MTQLQSDKVVLNKTAKEVFDFLSDFNNYQRLMPEQVVDWKSTADECSFTIKGMGSLGMKIVEKHPDTSVIIHKHGKAPFDFKLHCNIVNLPSQCEVQLVFDADLNPMLQLVASKPLTNFLNILASRLKDL